MSLFVIGPHGYGDEEITDVSSAGYKNAAERLVDRYNRGIISKDEKSYSAGNILRYYGASDIEELRTKLRGW